MMMCIGSVSDFEALTALARQMNPDAELRERMLRGEDWAYARRLDKRRPSELAKGLAGPIPEPPRPYSHGRRFIPAWLIADREFYMAASISCDYHGAEAMHRLYGLVRVDVDTTVMVRRK